MVTTRSFAFAAAALLFACSVSALPANAGGVVRGNLQPRETTASVQSIFNTLKSKTGPFSQNMKTLAKTASATSSMEDENAGLLAALDVALGGVTHLVGQLAGDVNLLDLAGTVVDVVKDVEDALTTIEKGLELDPTLAPIVATLAGILNGPLVDLLSAVTGLTSGLLPIVQGLLSTLGLDGLLSGVGGLLGGLIGFLGL
ncbi:hypothetical protein RQP46_011200 [Phenoliferia psychrophenolica]